ncbi:MAG: 1-acyl-sn-glycerol-3-phosphate acyltransferase [Anaerolineaceae bacterium]|nr:1-acyl-sn-glycerol-3-phosphate acyltransferase [Anaerolineaceae bacterium]
MERKTLLKLISYAFRHLTRTEFVGVENVPTTGGIIIATNHMSRLDVPLLFITPNRPDISALAADKYKKHPLFSIILNAAKVIWLDREKADFSALSAARQYIQDGGAIGIAPEGTRSNTRALIEGKPGAALLAARAQCPIVPVGIAGTESAIMKLMAFHFPRLVVRYGKPFWLPPMSQRDRSSWLNRCTDEIMCQIAALLPEQYHGFYRDHPRLRVLLNSTS